MTLGVVVDVPAVVVLPVTVEVVVEKLVLLVLIAIRRVYYKFYSKCKQCSLYSFFIMSHPYKR